MVNCSPSGLKSTFANLLGSYLSLQMEECLLLLLTSLTKTSVLLMDESLPALHLKLLEMCHETVELVMFFPLKSPATTLCLSCSSCNFAFLDCLAMDCFCHPLLCCCCGNEGPDRKGSYFRQTLKKLPLSFSFILLTLLNGR